MVILWLGRDPDFARTEPAVIEAVLRYSNFELTLRLHTEEVIESWDIVFGLCPRMLVEVVMEWRTDLNWDQKAPVGVVIV
jgi:hypothetical protein